MPLHYAARGGHLAVVQHLLHCGKLCNLCHPVIAPQVVRLQLERLAGAEVNAQTGAGRATALQRAAYMGHINVVKLL